MEGDGLVRPAESWGEVGKWLGSSLSPILLSPFCVRWRVSVALAVCSASERGAQGAASMGAQMPCGELGPSIAFARLRNRKPNEIHFVADSEDELAPVANYKAPSAAWYASSRRMQSSQLPSQWVALARCGTFEKRGTAGELVPKAAVGTVAEYSISRRTSY